jgi:hypothetical protein
MLLVLAWSVHFALQAGVEQLEIEHREFGRIGMGLDPNRLHQTKRQHHTNGCELYSHDGDP